MNWHSTTMLSGLRIVRFLPNLQDDTLRRSLKEWPYHNFMRMKYILSLEKNTVIWSNNEVLTIEGFPYGLCVWLRAANPFVEMECKLPNVYEVWRSKSPFRDEDKDGERWSSFQQGTDWLSRYADMSRGYFGPDGYTIDENGNWHSYDYKLSLFRNLYGYRSGKTLHLKAYTENLKRRGIETITVSAMHQLPKSPEFVKLKDAAQTYRDRVHGSRYEWPVYLFEK